MWDLGQALVHHAVAAERTAPGAARAKARVVERRPRRRESFIMGETIVRRTAQVKELATSPRKMAAPIAFYTFISLSCLIDTL